MTNDSARHLQRWGDTMAKYLGELDRLTYAAEIMCPERRGCLCHDIKQPCPFKSKQFPTAEWYVCKLRKMRILIGDHVKQDNIGDR
jgi:hypothetical protein